jgi:DNA-binding response OmpR family regulator
LLAPALPSKRERASFYRKIAELSPQEAFASVGCGASMIRVLVVEDKRHLAAALARWLRRQGMTVDEAYDGQAALAQARHGAYDVVVLDRNLPLVHGDDVCRELAQVRPTTRVLMLTAADSSEDLVDGLDLGADDYMAKPVVLAELAARLRALTRRAGVPQADVLVRGDLVVDTSSRTVTRSGRAIVLTAREFDLLEELLRADGRVVAASTLRRRLWETRCEVTNNTVRVTMLRLRRKLAEPSPIETVTGAGYRIP